jgi:poly(A)-specific ribonuclease
MQVVPLDVEEEAKFRASKVAGFAASLIRSRGVRIIFEALSGADLSYIKPEWLCVSPTGAPAFLDMGAISADLSSTVAAIQGKPAVIIGHNLMTDLAFLYATFVGPLPSSVAQFQGTIHALFPRVIDTKYMATRELGTIPKASSGLAELWESVRSFPEPVVKLAKGFDKYGEVMALHEAGFDSLLTAKCFLKLACHLKAEWDADWGSEGSYATASQGSGRGSGGESQGSGSEESGGGLMELQHVATANTFGVLAGLGGAGEESLLDSSDYGRVAIKAIVPKKRGGNEMEGLEEEGANAVEARWLPGMDDPFWANYLNFLRVYASAEGVCHLAAIEKQA